MTVLGFLAMPWVLAWLGVGVVCALVVAVSVYRNGAFESPGSGSVSIWDEAIDRTAHAITITIIFIFTVVAWPFVAPVLAVNLWMAHRDAIINEKLDRSYW